MAEMDETGEKMESFDRKIARIFREELPEMPGLPEMPEVEELAPETLDQLQAAGDSMPAAEILRFLKGAKQTGRTL